jgi:hypothetical protein
MTPRRVAWLLFAVAAVFLFLAALRTSGVGGLANWFEDAGLCALAVGCTMWALPQQPPTVP